MMSSFHLWCHCFIYDVIVPFMMSLFHLRCHCFNYDIIVPFMISLFHLWCHCSIYDVIVPFMMSLFHLWCHCFVRQHFKTIPSTTIQLSNQNRPQYTMENLLVQSELCRISYMPNNFQSKCNNDQSCCRIKLPNNLTGQSNLSIKIISIVIIVVQSNHKCKTMINRGIQSESPEQSYLFNPYNKSRLFRFKV